MSNRLSMLAQKEQADRKRKVSIHQPAQVDELQLGTSDTDWVRSIATMQFVSHA